MEMNFVFWCVLMFYVLFVDVIEIGYCIIEGVFLDGI